MGIAWLVTLPCAAVVGALTSLIAVRGGVLGTVAVIVLLLVGAWLIIRQAGHNRVDFSNVNDADSVVVARQSDPELGRAPKTLNEVKDELVSAAAITSTAAPAASQAPRKESIV
jgi:piT family inorganic phosphate transporter